MLGPEVGEECCLVDNGDAEAGGAGEVGIQEVAVLIGNVGQEVGAVCEVDLFVTIGQLRGPLKGSTRTLLRTIVSREA